MAPTNRPRVFLDVNIGEHPAGRLTIELFADKTPKTCENFRQLCTAEHKGLSYAKSPFHRVIDEFMVQGGDIANGDGTGTASIYGGEFEDENLHWRELDAALLVCAANRGKDTNGSQFFITLEACPHLNGKHTVFGRLVSGQETLEKLAKIDVDKNDVPLDPVLIARCGELEKKRKRLSPVPQARPAPESADRGRRRKSDVSDEEMEDSPEPNRSRRSRRQSDNVVDEGLRGRPRQRSHSRSHSRALSTTDDESGDRDSSGLTKHKRKRSPSPSRQPNGMKSGGDHEQRRQRSLPNQYAAEKQRVKRDDEERYRPSPRRDDYRHSGHKRNDENRHRRDHDHYQPARGSGRYENHDNRLGTGSDGRLGGYDDGYEPPVKFKGRGAMKYRESGRL